jgi:hypothetical protein
LRTLRSLIIIYLLDLRKDPVIRSSHTIYTERSNKKDLLLLNDFLVFR